MNDVYDDAIAVPRILRGNRSPRSYADLIASGASPAALRWAVVKTRTARPFRGTYLPGGLSGLLDVIRCALLVSPRACALGYHTAALLYGFGVVGSDSVHIVVPVSTPVPQRRGVVAHESVVPFGHIVDLFGLPCLPAARCAIDLARALPRPDALAVLDAALRSGAVNRAELEAGLARHIALRGIVQGRELVPLATPAAECRQETHTRLLLHDARLPAPKPQLEVLDEWGVERYRLDLGFEEQRVGLEYDGASHLDRRRMRGDRSRHNWLSDRGWTMRYFTDEDLYRRPDHLVSTARSALLSRRSRTSMPIKEM